MKRAFGLILTLVMCLCLCVGAFAADAGPADRALPDDTGYVDYSSDKTAIFFNTTGDYNGAVFMDFYYPFDSTLKLNHYDALAKYELADDIIKDGDSIFASLDELSKLYAPYFTYGVDDGMVTVRHIQFTKTVTAGAGTRQPKLDYVKTIWEAKFDTAGEDIDVTKTVYEAFNTTAANGVVDAMAAAAVKEVVPVEAEAFAVKVVGGKVYAPIEDLMTVLGKTVFTKGDYLTVRSEDIVNTITATGYKKADPTNAYTYESVDQDYTWADYMDGVLDGSITKGHHWRAFYIGTEDLIYSNGPTAADDEVREDVEVNRIIPFNVYIPETYDPAVPSKLTFELHGSTGNENAPTERISDRDLHIEPYADEYGYIVLSPNGWTRGPSWVNGPARYSFLKSLEMVQEEWKVDKDKMFIAGNSAGGGGTWDLFLKYPEKFKAASPEAPTTSMSTLTDEKIAEIKEVIDGKPIMFTYGIADATIPYYTKHVPWVENYADKLFDDDANVIFTAIESGHHSYSFGSVTQQKFDFFDSVLEPYTDTYDFATLTLNKNSAIAKIDSQSYTLDKPTKTSGDKTMIALSDLEKLYGESFKVYDVAAYNTDSSAKDETVTIIYNNTAVNIKADSNFLRINAALYASDVPEGKETSSATGGGTVADYITDTLTLSVNTIAEGDELYVPAVELMEIFGETVKTQASSNTGGSGGVGQPSISKDPVKPPESIAFTDVAKGAYYYDAVQWAIEKKITNGTSATTFSPDDVCTRAQAATFLWNAVGKPAPKGSNTKFTDVPANAYYADAVQWAVEQGILKGTSDTTFSPDDTVTRAQIITLMWRMEKSPESASANKFEDVNDGDYFADAVDWAVEKKITNGTSATTFSPNAGGTRGQIVTMLYNYMAK